MESLSQPVARITIPLAIPVPGHLRDHHIGGRAVLPAVEALQYVARSKPAAWNADPCLQQRAVFHHLLEIDPGAVEIPALHEHALYADGSCLSRLSTLRSGRQLKFTRRMAHASVWFMPAGRGAGNETAPPAVAARARRVTSTSEEESFFEKNFPSNPDHAGMTGPTFMISAGRLYDELVPFGPAYRNVQGDVFLAESGVSTTVSGGDFPEAGGPLGSPFPLDAAMHAACAWGQRYRNRVVFPIGFDQREILAPTRAGGIYLCRVVPLPDAGAVLRFDIRLHGRDGRPVEVIRGLSMREIIGGGLIPPAWVREGV